MTSLLKNDDVIPIKTFLSQDQEFLSKTSFVPKMGLIEQKLRFLGGVCKFAHPPQDRGSKYPPPR